MATAYSTLLGLALPVQGELSGTWGDMVDNGITRYVDIAVAGTVTLTNDGAVTLSLTNGDSSATNIVSSLTGAGTVSAQFAIIKVTGTLTTAKVLTPPSSSRTYVVVNAATGSTVTVKASGQTGVSIAVGETAFVYFNGTDYVKVAGTVNTGVTSFQTSLSGLTPSTATTGAVTLAGTLATTNGGTGLTSFTSGGVVYASSSSALATGSALTFDGTRLSTSGLNLTTSSGTANTILMTGSGTAAVYTQYQNTGGNFYVGRDNSAGNLFGSSYASFLYATGAYPMIFLTNDAERLRITSAGNVGIGTSSPNRLLSLYATQPVFQITNVACGNTQGTIQYQASGATDFILDNQGSGSGGDIIFQQAGSERMRISSAGNVGIGTSSPGAKLDVNSGSASGSGIVNTLLLRNPGVFSNDGPKIVFTAGTSTDGAGIGAGGVSLNAADLRFYAGGNTERVRISAAGGFSVGTTADPGAGAIYATGNITAYYSDARLKTVSGKIENALDKVGKLSGVYYTNNDTAKSFGYDSDEVQVGVIAQEVEAVLPQIVKAAPFDLDADGNSKSGENYKTVQYERLVPLLIEAINELQAKVKALEAK
jgi:hypothetical protein